MHKITVQHRRISNLSGKKALDTQKESTQRRDTNCTTNFKRWVRRQKRWHITRRQVPQILQLSAIECGAACLAMILSYYGRKTSISEIRERYGVGRDGLSARHIVNAGRAFGMRVRAVSVQGDTLKHVTFPAIAHWEFNHFIVIKRWTPDRVEVIDPGVGQRSLTRAEFNAGFTGVIIMMEPGDQFERQTRSSEISILSYTKEYLKRAPAVILQILATSLVLQVFGLSIPILTEVLIDHVIPLHLTAILLILGIGMGLLVVTQGLVGLLRSWLLIYLQNRIDIHFMPGFIEHMLSLPLAFFQQRASGDLLARISSNEAVRNMISAQFISTILDGSFVLIYLAILIWQSSLYTMIALSVGIIQIVLLMFTNRMVLRLYGQELEAQGKTQSYETEMLNGIETIKASGTEQEAFQHWTNSFCELLNITARRNTIVATMGSIIGSLRTIAPLAFLWIGTLEVINGEMSIGTMLALNALATTFLMPLSSLVDATTELQFIRSHLFRVADVTEARPEQDTRIARTSPVLTGNIQMKHVYFRYDQQGPEILQDISLDITAGQKIALVGQTGSGKSTLGKLLLALYPPTEGEILYDSHPLHTLNYQTVRAQCGVVMQDATIFSGTIRQNIAFNDPDIHMEQTIKAAQIAALHEDIERMPMYYETFVSEGGRALSGGQRQRLALARAISHAPAILLLDEATSALDVITEKQVEHNLNNLTCTQIIIAHRLSTIQHADSIIVMNQGRIVEQGTHQELLQHNGYYANLIYNQLIPE